MNNSTKNILLIVALLIIIALSIAIGYVAHHQTEVLVKVNNDSLNAFMHEQSELNRKDSMDAAHRFDTIKKIISTKNERIQIIHHFTRPDIDEWIKSYCARRAILPANPGIK